MTVQRGEAPLDARGVEGTFGVLVVVMALASLSQMTPATALPAISSEFGAPGFGVITAYLFAAIASAAAWAGLGGRFGRKPFLMAAIAVFLIGSALCGHAWDLGSLVAFRALQGAGGGGVIALTLAIVGDLVSPRDRGRYREIVGVIYGLCAIAGPVFGGFFVDRLSWRWIFLVNLPFSVVALAVLAILLPSGREGRRPAGSVGTVPPVPARLFRNPVFVVGGAIDFVAGFVMFGAVAYLPAFLQAVTAEPAVISGVLLLPLAPAVFAGVLLSGRMIGAYGACRACAVAGMAVTTTGLFLLSRADEQTPASALPPALCVLGLGLGLVAPVPLIAVQNAVGYRDLGAAGSGVTSCRAIGALTGVTVLGAALGRRAASEPDAVSFHAMFEIAIPVALAGLLLGVFLKGAPLRAMAASPDLGRCLGPAPPPRSSRDEIERLLFRRIRSDPEAGRKVRDVYRDLDARTGIDCSPAGLLALCRIAGLTERAGESGDGRLINRLIAEGLVGHGDTDLVITDAGRAVTEQLHEGMRQTLAELLADWSPEDHPELLELLAGLSREPILDDTGAARPGAAARAT